MKSQLLLILNAVAAVAGAPIRYLLGLAIWAVGKYVPDAAPGFAVPTTVGAAPDNVKAVLRDLFDKAANLIPNAFYRRIVASVATLVLDRFIDTAWDALVGVIKFESATPVSEADATLVDSVLETAGQ